MGSFHSLWSPSLSEVIQIGFNKPKTQATEVYNADEMTRAFMGVFKEVILATSQIVVFDFHGMTLKGVVRGLSPIELAQKQGGQRGRPASLGFLMDKTDVTFIKFADSGIQIKGSAKKCFLDHKLNANRALELTWSVYYPKGTPKCDFGLEFQV